MTAVGDGPRCGDGRCGEVTARGRDPFLGVRGVRRVVVVVRLLGDRVVREPGATRGAGHDDEWGGERMTRREGDVDRRQRLGRAGLADGARPAGVASRRGQPLLVQPAGVVVELLELPPALLVPAELAPLPALLRTVTLLIFQPEDTLVRSVTICSTSAAGACILLFTYV